jgi:hypothetical protein
VYALFLCVSVCVHVFACVYGIQKNLLVISNFFFVFPFMHSPISRLAKNIWRVFEGGKFNFFFFKVAMPGRLNGMKMYEWDKGDKGDKGCVA